ncbi:MAG: LysR family transcriptional regulator [Coriobacteriales bacterium]|jgi:DNA-binding transcriptional LysR family regulator
MDTDKCAALLRVIEKGSLSAAASELGYTPSGISRLVASLEAEVGFPLLVRSKAGVAPTEECERLMPVMAELAALGRTFSEKAAALKGLESGSLRVGSAYRQLYGPLARILAEFARRYPGVRVDMVQANSTYLAGQLRRREADFCIMSKREGLERWVPLLQDRMVAVLPKDHELAQAKSYPIERFSSDSFIEIYPGEESDNSRTLAKAGVNVEPRFSVFDTHAAFALVEAGLGVTMMNEIYAEATDADIVWVPVRPNTVIELGVGLPAAELSSPALDVFENFALPKLQTQVKRG